MALVLNFKLFTEAVTDSDPTESKLPFSVKPIRKVPNP
jgi:hypothetical protein